MRRPPVSDFDPIHAICVRMNDKPCDLCPAWESSVYGPGKRGCRSLAEEVATIARCGNPWGPHAKPEHVAAWQQRFNDE
jgi:hypothetical protein